MISLLKKLKGCTQDNSGAAVVEASLLFPLFIIFLGSSIEAGLAFWKWNTAQQSARIGARLAATSTPVALGLETHTGLDGQTEPGDPIPDYTFNCSGKNKSCNMGGFDQVAMNRIFYGPDNDGVCAGNERKRQGMCDVLTGLTMDQVSIIYESSGLGTAGNPSDPMPIIKIIIADMSINGSFLNIISANKFQKLPNIEISMLAEDLKIGG